MKAMIYLHAIIVVLVFECESKKALSLSVRFTFDYSSILIFFCIIPFQVLLTLFTCCLLFGVNTLAIHDTSSKGKELTGAAWDIMQLYCAAIFILLILISGHLVTNAVRH